MNFGVVTDPLLAYSRRRNRRNGGIIANCATAHLDEISVTVTFFFPVHLLQ